MRPLEISLLISLPILLILFWFRRSVPPWLLITIPAVALALILLHVVIEGQRWQMIPAYVLTAVLAAGLIFGATNGLFNGRAATILSSLLGTPLIIAAIALPIALPVPNPPNPTGRFAVGTASYHWIDQSRPEIYTDDPNDVREIMVQFWYPADPAEAATADPAPFLTNLDIVAPALARRFGFPSFLLNHIGLVQTASVLDVPVAADQPQYPVIIFSPGYNSLRNQSASLMEELASHGYIVVALDHTYVGALTIFPGGRIEYLNPDALPSREAVGDEAYFEKAHLIGDVWSADVQYVLGRLETEEMDERFSGRLDLSRLGILGHSTGSGVAAILTATDGRFDVGVGMDAWLGPMPQTIQNQGTDKPYLFLMSELWPTEENKGFIRTYVNNASQSQYLTIADTAHYDFTEIPLLTPLSGRIGLSGPINSYRAHELIHTHVLAYFNQTLKAEPTLLFEEAQYPEITIE